MALGELHKNGKQNKVLFAIFDFKIFCGVILLTSYSGCGQKYRFSIFCSKKDIGCPLGLDLSLLFSSINKFYAAFFRRLYSPIIMPPKEPSVLLKSNKKYLANSNRVNTLSLSLDLSLISTLKEILISFMI